MTLLCQCGIVSRPPRFPVRCACGRRYTAPGQLSEEPPKARRAAPAIRVPKEIIVAAEAEALKRGLLAGDMIAALTTALGIPPCGGCERRKEWLNRAHAWLRGDPTGDKPGA